MFKFPLKKVVTETISSVAFPDFYNGKYLIDIKKKIDLYVLVLALLWIHCKI